MPRPPRRRHGNVRGVRAVGAKPKTGPTPDSGESPDGASEAALLELGGRWPFGAAFFLGQLGAFVREKCPEPGEGLPVVEIHVMDGGVLDLCHVIGVAPTWVALAVNNLKPVEGAPAMRTELVPYARIVQVTVRSCRTHAPHIGFVHDHVPHVIAEPEAAVATPEDALRAASAPGFTPQAKGGGAASNGGTEGRPAKPNPRHAKRKGEQAGLA